MSKNVNYLERIDKYFESKSESEKWLLILIVAGTVAFLAYSFLYPSAKSAYDASIVRHTTIVKKINEDQRYLASISKNGDRSYKIKELNKQIFSKNNTLKEYAKKIKTIKTSLNKLSDLLFNKDTWSKFLDSITERAASNSVQINSLSNKYVDGNGSFGHVLEIGVNCTGEYNNILKFINDIEQNTLVTDVYGSRTYSDINNSRIVSDINISVWGINH